MSTKVSYIAIGYGRITVEFANFVDAQEVAVSLLDVPGVVSIFIQEQGFNGYPIHRNCRYQLYVSDDKAGNKWHKKEYSHIADAAHEGENHLHYQIHDMFTSEILRPEDVACLV